MDFAPRKSIFFVHSDVHVETYWDSQDLQKFAWKNFEFFELWSFQHEHQNEQKKLIFSARNPQIFDDYFSQCRGNKTHSIIFSARAFSNDSRFHFFFCVFIIIRDAQISEVKSLFCCSIEPKKKNSTRSPKRLTSDEKTQKIRFSRWNRKSARASFQN